MEHYKAERPLVINKADSGPIVVEPGQIVYTDSDGTLNTCSPEDLADVEARVDAEIAAQQPAE